MKKLIIQVPCLNEESTLKSVLSDFPTSIEGIDLIESQIIDDGSTDGTVEIAKKCKVDYILKNVGNKGLGNSFRIGVENALKQNVDILVNTDGDNQYPSSYIKDLVLPILRGEADIVIGDRQTSSIKHFSFIKRFFQWLGTKVTIFLSGEREVADAVSGFRAYSRQALLELNVTSSFSYVLDTTVQASKKKIRMVAVPIETNMPTRPSRLFKNIWQHIRKSGTDILRVYAMYKPLRVFFVLGLISFIIGVIPIFRFILDYVGGNSEGKIQSLVIGSSILVISFNFFALGIIGELMSKNRNLIEQLLKHSKENSSTIFENAKDKNNLRTKNSLELRKKLSETQTKIESLKNYREE